MKTTYSYACKDYPGMAECPASFTTEKEEELWRHIEVHGAIGHQEDPGKWSPEERQQMKKLIRST